jgi:hypothetical protein
LSFVCTAPTSQNAGALEIVTMEWLEHTYTFHMMRNYLVSRGCFLYNCYFCSYSASQTLQSLIQLFHTAI